MPDIEEAQKVEAGVVKPNRGGAKTHVHKEGILRKKRRSYPTVRQIKTLQYMNQGMSKRKAMIQAGYKPGWAGRPYKSFFKSPAVRSVLLGMKDILVAEGLTKEYMASKFKIWLEAGKPDGTPDFETQIKGYDRWKDIMEKEEQIVGNQGKVKRKIEFTEFVTGSDIAK